FGPQLGCRLLGRELGPVRPRLAHRLEGVRRGEDPGCTRDLVPRDPTRIPRAVQSLLVLHGNGAERRQGPRRVKHSLRQVRMEPNALPLACTQCSGLVPDRIRYAQATEIVDEPRPAQEAQLGARTPELRRRTGREICHRPSMTEAVWGLPIDEV